MVSFVTTALRKSQDVPSSKSRDGKLQALTGKEQMIGERQGQNWEEELWRRVYTPLLQIQQADFNRPLVLAVSSSQDGEGKTTVALGMALAMARDLDKSILLMDCNLARPGLSQAIGATEDSSGLGIANILVGECQLEDAAHKTGIGNLWVAPAGGHVANPSKLIRSAAMDALISLARCSYDIVIIDAPSMLSSSDARLLVSNADCLVCVARVGVSSTKSVAKTMDLAKRVAERAIVVNDFQTSLPGWMQGILLNGNW